MMPGRRQAAARAAAMLGLALAGIALAIGLTSAAAGAQAEPGDIDPRLLSQPELPPGFMQRINPLTDSGGSFKELVCDVRRRIGLSGTFIADSDISTLTTVEGGPAVALYTLVDGSGDLDDLTLVGCPPPSEPRPGIFQRSFATHPGQRYWVLTGDEQAMTIVRDAPAIDDALALRFELVDTDLGLSLRTEFTFPPVGDHGDVAGDAACRQTLLSFEAVKPDTTLWASNADNAFAVYKAPDGDDPRSPGFGGPESVVECGSSWGEPSSVGSVRRTFETVAGERYVIGWASTANAALALELLGDFDEQVARPVRLGVDGVRPGAWVPQTGCLTGLGYGRTRVDNVGIEIETVGLVTRRIDGPAPSARSHTEDIRPNGFTFLEVAELTDGEYEADIFFDGDLVTTKPFSIACSGGVRFDSPFVRTIESCAAGLVRIDVVIENRSDSPATYVTQFRHGAFRRNKSARIDAHGQGRITITGRPLDTALALTVFRNGETIERAGHQTTCGDDPHPRGPEVIVTTSCLGGNGLIRYVVLNNTPERKAWLVSFPGLSIRSTSAEPWAVALGGISGRADGTYRVQFRDYDDIRNVQVTIDCDD